MLANNKLPIKLKAEAADASLASSVVGAAAETGKKGGWSWNEPSQCIPLMNEKELACSSG